MLACVVLSALTGCVYYNAFYHAKAAAREAAYLREVRPPDREPTIREIEMLDRAIEKSGRVLRLHPDSDWADDALLLLGTSLYYRGKYESAEVRLTEFLTRYPDSPLRAEAEYALAGVMLENDNPVSAEELLTDVAYAEPPVDLSDDALLLVGDARAARGRYDGAAEAYNQLLERFPKSRRRAEARLRAAENYTKMGRQEDAIPQYAAVTEEGGGRELHFEARLKLAEAHLDLEEPVEALAVLRELEGRTTVDEELDQVLLLVGRAQTVAGDLEDAVSTYEGIAASRERTAAAGEAHYRIGLIRRDRHRDLEGAASSFNTAKSQAPRSDVAKLATDAASAIATLQEYLSTIADHEAETAGATPADTTGVAEAKAPATADTAGVAEATAPATADTAGPAEATAPATADTISLETEPVPAGGDTTDLAAARSETTALEPFPEVATARFRVAEIYLFEFDDPSTALTYYEDVVTLHPLSKEAPKAALARAWIFANRLDDSGSAEEAYGYVADTYPWTDYSAAALAALGLPGEPRPTEVAPEDTSRTEPAHEEGASADTTRVEAAPAPADRDASEPDSDEPQATEPEAD